MFKTKTGEATTIVEQNQGFTPSFAQVKAKDTVAKEETTKPKFVFLVGGLAGSGKTSHMLPLIHHLTEELALSVNYLDKDLIGRTMPGATSPQVYDAMMARAVIADEDVIIHEGNIVGNLSLFRDYVRSQHDLGATVICLDFQCSDAKMQHARLVERAAVDSDAKQRDLKKLDFDFYTATDRPGEIAKRDKQIGFNQDLIGAGIINFKVIDTTTASIQENVASIVKCMYDLNPNASRAHALRLVAGM